MKLMIMLKSTDADSLGGEILESLGMTRNLTDSKRFSKNLGIAELVNKAQNYLNDDDEEDDVSANVNPGMRRRRRRLKSLNDFLIYEDNSLYALPYVEPLTDRGIMPLKVQLITDSTAGMTPIGASAMDDLKARAAEYLEKNKKVFGHTELLVEAAAMELDLYEDETSMEIPSWLSAMAEKVK